MRGVRPKENMADNMKILPLQVKSVRPSHVTQMASLRHKHLIRLLLHHLHWLCLWLEPLCLSHHPSWCPANQKPAPPGRPSPSCCFLDPLARWRRSVCGETSKLSVSCGQGCQTGRVLCWTDEAAYRTSCWIKTAALNNQMWSGLFKKTDFIRCVSL